MLNLLRHNHYQPVPRLSSYAIQAALDHLQYWHGGKAISRSRPPKRTFPVVNRWTQHLSCSGTSSTLNNRANILEKKSHSINILMKYKRWLFHLCYFFPLCSGGSSSSTSVLTFTPEPEDDGAILACRAENPAMNSNEGERFGGGERLNNRRTTAALEYSRTLDVHCEYHKNKHKACCLQKIFRIY